MLVLIDPRRMTPHPRNDRVLAENAIEAGQAVWWYGVEDVAQPLLSAEVEMVEACLIGGRLWQGV
ncbi:hypothetical protein [Actinophytocola sp.]|uniref:hypothetical protein n=1 Tax=Actinophytocola sp. TaxID=1872138 RepID=UPI00389A725B